MCFSWSWLPRMVDPFEHERAKFHSGAPKVCQKVAHLPNLDGKPLKIFSTSCHRHTWNGSSKSCHYIHGLLCPLSLPATKVFSVFCWDVLRHRTWSNDGHLRLLHCQHIVWEMWLHTMLERPQSPHPRRLLILYNIIKARRGVDAQR